MLAPSCNCRVIAQAVGLRTRNARWLEGFFYDSLVGDRHHNSIGEITPDEMLSGKENAIREESVIRLDDSQYAFAKHLHIQLRRDYSKDNRLEGRLCSKGIPPRTPSTGFFLIS